MSTKKETNTDSSSKLSFDPQSMARYQDLQGAGSGILTQYMKTPFDNPFYNLGMGQSQNAASQAGGNLMKALMQNMKVSGMSGKSGNAFQLAQMGKIGRTTASLHGGAAMQNIFQALNRQLAATGQAMAYNPLMTGESSKSHAEEKTSGTGTWLPQLMGMALQGAMGAATGGASLAFPGMSPGMISGAFGGPTMAASQPSFLPNHL